MRRKTMDFNRKYPVFSLRKCAGNSDPFELRKAAVCKVWMKRNSRLFKNKIINYKYRTHKLIKQAVMVKCVDLYILCSCIIC